MVGYRQYDLLILLGKAFNVLYELQRPHNLLPGALEDHIRHDLREMERRILILRNPAVGHKLIERVHIQLRFPFPEHIHGKGLGGEERELNEQLLFGFVELCHVENSLQIRKGSLIPAGSAVLAERNVCGSHIGKAMV